jgi:hypothetical protein
MSRSRIRFGDLHKVFMGGSSDLLNQIAHLSILFEDLRIEVAGIQAAEDTLGAMDTIKSNHRRLYFTRRTLVTLSEMATCIAGIAGNLEFRARIPHIRGKHIEHVDEANSYFSKNIGLIRRFRNEFGAHLDKSAVGRVTALLGPGTSSKVAFADQKNNNFVLQNAFAATILNTAILSRLEPGVDLEQEFKAALKVIADSVLHSQRATQALVYGFIWDRFN